MKTILILVTILTSIQTMAGGSGGGGVLAASVGNGIEQKVRFVNASDEVITFDHAVKFQDQVKVERLTTKISEIQDQVVLKSLESSYQNNSWVEVK